MYHNSRLLVKIKKVPLLIILHEK